MGSIGDGLKIRGNSLPMTGAVTITGSSRCLMPNGPLRVRLTGQLPTVTQWTLCQFTIILAFVMQRSTNMPLFTDLWIIQLEQNAMTHFWSKSHYQGEEAFSRRYVFLSAEDKSFPPQHDLWLTVRIKPHNRKSLRNIPHMDDNPYVWIKESTWIKHYCHITPYPVGIWPLHRVKKNEACIIWKFSLEISCPFTLWRMAGDYRLVTRHTHPLQSFVWRKPFVTPKASITI